MLGPFHATGETITAARQTNAADTIDPGSTSEAFKSTKMEPRSRPSSPESFDGEKQNTSDANAGGAPSCRSEFLLFLTDKKVFHKEKEAQIKIGGEKKVQTLSKAKEFPYISGLEVCLSHL